MKKFIRCSDNQEDLTLNLGLGFLWGDDVDYPEDDKRLNNLFTHIFNKNDVSILDVDFYDWDDMYEDSIMELNDGGTEEAPHYEKIFEGILDIPADAYERGLAPSGVQISISCSYIADDSIRNSIATQLSDALPRIGYAVESLVWE